MEATTKCESSETASGELAASSVSLHAQRTREQGETQAQAQTRREQSLAVVTAKNFISGIVGGGCEAVVGYPLETVKARMQTQQALAGSAQAFSGPLDVVRKSIREEGLSSLYRGASPQIFRSAVSASIMFGLMGQYRYFYSKTMFDDPNYSLMAAGLSTGFTEGLLYTPFEVIKIRMQTQYHTPVSNWQCLKDVLSHNGLRGLYRGFRPTATREMLGNATYFMVYETVKELLVDRFVTRVPDLSPEKAHLRTYQSIAFAGGLAGFMCWSVNFPVDTVKSVMQADRLDKPRYAGVTDCCRQLYAEGGVARFYRGISPTLLRSFPANAITFLAFEKCMSLLNQLF